MNILIIVAMQKEMNLLLPLLENDKEITEGGQTYHCGNIGGHRVSLAKCGIGKVNSALSTLKPIRSVRPDLVINSGVAGGAAEDVHPLDVVVASAVAYHDVWCGPGTEYGAADGFPVRMHPTERIVDAAVKACPGVRKGLICSGDKFIDTVGQVEESASILQTCISEDVDCAIIRVISDSPRSGDNFAQYVNFWDDAPKATFAALTSILEIL